MMKSTLPQIRKRDGSLASFDPVKIEIAIYKALMATKTGDTDLAAQLAQRAVGIVEDRYAHAVPGVEDIQDIVENVLMAQGYTTAAKAYILYRQRRATERRLKEVIGVRDDLKLSVNAIKVLERRYLLRDEDGHVIETPSE